MSWLDKTANITRLRHINLHKCWLLAGFLFGIMILWVGIWLEPNLSQQDLISQVRSQLLAFHQIELQNLTKLTPAFSCSCWFLSLCVRLLHREFQRSRHPLPSEEEGSRHSRRRGTRTGGCFLSTEESLFPNPVSSLWASAYPLLHWWEGRVT